MEKTFNIEFNNKIQLKMGFPFVKESKMCMLHFPYPALILVDFATYKRIFLLFIMLLTKLIRYTWRECIKFLIFYVIFSHCK